MLFRINKAVTRLGHSLNYQALRCAGGYAAPSNLRQPVMDDLPVPKGSWQEGYDKANKRFNVQLAVGAVLFLFSTAYFLKQDFVWAGMPPPMKNKKN